MNKLVVFDWGGIILHSISGTNSDKDAIIRTIKSFNDKLSDEDAFSVYRKTLADENGIYISRQNDEDSKTKWLERLKKAGGFLASNSEIENKFISEYLKTDYYKDVVNYIHSLKSRCKIGLLSDLIYVCYPALNFQANLKNFDYVWLSYELHYLKNDKKIFEIITGQTGLSPQNIMLIDDTLINIENARQCGWNASQSSGENLEKMKEEIENFLNN